MNSKSVLRPAIKVTLLGAKLEVVMDWWVILVISFGALVALFCMGLPIAIAFLAIDIIGLYLLFGAKGMSLLGNSIFESVATFSLSPIPMFVLLGEIFYESEVVDIAFDTIDKWVGKVRARLHLVTLLFATIFGAISGSGMAMASMLGSTVLPEMNRRGYDKHLSLGVIMGGSCIDPLIPPSIGFVLIGGLANVSVGKLLISGIGPGILLLIFLVAYVFIYVKIKPNAAPVYLVSSSLGEKIKSLFHFIPFLIIIFLVVGLMMLGIATPTESAGAGVIGGIVVAACYRRLTFQMVMKCLWSTIRVTAMIFLIIAGAKAFAQILAISGGAQGLVSLILSLQLSRWGLLFLMMLIPAILGCFIDGVAIMMMTIPIYIPVVATAGFDPIWFWCMFQINITLGGITPPFGIFLFALKATDPESRLEEVYRAAIPFVVIVIFCITVVALFPGIAVWLPNIAYRF